MTKLRYRSICSFIAIFLLVGPFQLALARQKDKVLAQELAARVKVDQDARNAWIKYMQANPKPTWKPGEEPDVFKELKKVDGDNLNWLKQIVEKHGWPGKGLVGKKSASDAWLLVQHCDEDKPFQKKCLALMEPLLSKGEVEKKDYAYLMDRVLVGEGKKQIYGTQTKIVNGDCIPNPVEDEANLDKRRKEMGMMPMAVYLKMVREMYLGKKP